MPMHTTLLASGLLGLLFMVLSVRVTQIRRSAKVSIGDGDHQPLLSRIRAHANFAEYVPLLLILLGLIEYITGTTNLLKGLAAVLVIARVAHAIGMAQPAPNAFRIIGTMGTWIVLVLFSLWTVWLAT